MNTTSRRTRRTLLAAAAAAPLLLAPTTFAAATTAPQPRPRPRPAAVQVESSWHFVIGGQVDRTVAAPRYQYDWGVFHRAVPVELRWHAVGRTTIAGYDLYLTQYDTTQVLDDSTATSYQMLHTDIAYPPNPHPGRLTDSLHPRFRLVATDVTGRTTTVETQRHPVFSEQENGTTYQDGRTVFPSAPTHGRGWYPIGGRGYDGGAALRSTTRGAMVRIPVTAHAGGQYVALEMSTGPGFGAVGVTVDGRRVDTVDTYRDTPKGRVLVAEYRIDAGRHTVTLVNLGVHHRATVELDGVFASD